jgi:SAM-dependent methyltransferase
MSRDAAQITGLYERHAQAYDRLRGRTLFERSWLDRFTTLLPPGGTVLDLGCGMGEPIARHLIGQGFRVTGVDAAPSLIAVCRERFPDGDWHVADMRRLDLGRHFDGILAWDSFFHLTPDDQRQMFAVFRAHAAENAALMFTSGPAAGEAIGTFEGEPLYHASLDPAEYRALLGVSGFHEVAHVPDDPGCAGHTIWLARSVSLGPRPPVISPGK